MKKHAILTMALAITLAVPVIAPAAKAPQTEATTESEGKEYTFRGIPWGSSVEDVKNSDFIKEYPNYVYSKKHNSITVYGITVAQKSSNAYLCFGDSGLYAAMYALAEEHTNLNNYVEDFNDVFDSLKKKYGEPDKVLDDWKDDLYKDDPSEYGMAVGAGHVNFIREWGENDTHIVLACLGDNFKIENDIMYEYTPLKPEETTDDGL
jgi:hypothetical protein